jgi:hypothetical protein
LNFFDVISYIKKFHIGNLKVPFIAKTHDCV